MKNLLMLLFAATLVGMTSAPSQAACLKTGTLVRVKMVDDSAKGKGPHVLYMRENKDDPFYYIAKTNDDEVAQSATFLAALQTRIMVKGNKSSCTETGTSRSLGKVVELIAVP